MADPSAGRPPPGPPPVLRERSPEELQRAHQIRSYRARRRSQRDSAGLRPLVLFGPFSASIEIARWIVKALRWAWGLPPRARRLRDSGGTRNGPSQ